LLLICKQHYKGVLARQGMTRKGKKPTVAQLEERIEQLGLAMGELQQFVNLIGASARNDIMRHEDLIQELCEKTGVEMKVHPLPEEVAEENIEESQGESV
jgi:phenylalanyl-tRNA synthetase beta subunit